MTRTPRISVVIPVFNAERYLEAAIVSVLAQDEAPLEILVVDDGSTDGSAAIAERFGHPVRVLRQDNRGHVIARNRGLSAARGEYVTTLDADDLYTSDKFALQASRLDLRPDIDIVIGQLSYLRMEPSTDEGHGDDAALTEHRDDHLTLSFGSSMVRRTVFDRVGLPDETMQYCDDWDWFMRVREAGVPLLLHRDVVLQQRLHTGNMTRDRDEGQRFLLAMMRRSLDRRRREGTTPDSLPPLASFFEAEEAT